MDTYCTCQSRLDDPLFRLTHLSISWKKVTSSAKKKLEPGSLKISQTPDGSFYDLQRNVWHLLQQCGLVGLPELGSVEQYLAQGPGFIFLYNPALGRWAIWGASSRVTRRVGLLIRPCF